MFRTRIPEPCPTVIVKVGQPPKESFNTKQLDMPCYRVFPRCYREVLFLQSLTNGYSVFAPADGDGVIVKHTYLPPL